MARLLSRNSRVRACAFALLLSVAAPLLHAAAFAPGEMVRLTRGETLLLDGKNFLGAPKGQEFSVVQHDSIRRFVAVAFYKEDGSVLAVTLPDEAVEASPPNAWGDLLAGLEAFRTQRFDDARRLLLRAAPDPQYGAPATALSTRINGALTAAQQARSPAPAARQAILGTLQNLRDTADQLNKLGYLSLALPLDEGTDRLAAQVLGPTANAAPATKLDRAELARRVATPQRTLWRARQAIAVRRLMEASRYLEEGLKAEPGRPELKALQTRVQKGIADAEDDYKAAARMRRFQGGAVHALSALEDGLKRCADHPKLRELRHEMQALFEERTAPPVNAAFLAAAEVSTSEQALSEGHRLYTTRCLECHELELLDSRSPSAWQRIVAGMARRANVDAAQQARIVDYLTAAIATLPDAK